MEKRDRQVILTGDNLRKSEERKKRRERVVDNLNWGLGCVGESDDEDLINLLTLFIEENEVEEIGRNELDRAVTGLLGKKTKQQKIHTWLTKPELEKEYVTKSGKVIDVKEVKVKKVKEKKKIQTLINWSLVRPVVNNQTFSVIDPVGSRAAEELQEQAGQEWTNKVHEVKEQLGDTKDVGAAIATTSNPSDRCEPQIEHESPVVDIRKQSSSPSALASYDEVVLDE